MDHTQKLGNLFPTSWLDQQGLPAGGGHRRRLPVEQTLILLHRDREPHCDWPNNFTQICCPEFWVCLPGKSSLLQRARQVSRERMISSPVAVLNPKPDSATQNTHDRIALRASFFLITRFYGLIAGRINTRNLNLQHAVQSRQYSTQEKYVSKILPTCETGLLKVFHVHRSFCRWMAAKEEGK